MVLAVPPLPAPLEPSHHADVPPEAFAAGKVALVPEQLSPWKEASEAYPSWTAEEGNENKEKATKHLLTHWVL